MTYKIKGWMLNGQMPTGNEIELEWNGIKYLASERKYSFLHIKKGLTHGFQHMIEIIDTSEKGAWDKLRELIG